MKRVKYICYYNYFTDKIKRENVQSASTKIDYIINVLNRNGISVDIISKSPISSSVFDFSIGGEIQMSASNTIRHFISLGCRRNKLLYALGRVFNTIHFFLWLFFNTIRGEKIIVYHSLGYTQSIMLIKKLKHIIVIGEIEEIYQHVHKQHLLTKKMEYKFIKQCDKYIFPTALLSEKFNVYRRPEVIIHGVYSVEDELEERYNDGKIHVVYGGTLDIKKGGAAAAAAAAEFLPEKYHVHICGFGDSTKITQIIKDVKSRTHADITFEGELKGSCYKKFIQKCHIGLSTQNPSAAFNNTSFPSKILVYFSNGLKVVTIRIPAIELSAVSDIVMFYDEQTPKEIANAILNTPLDNGDKSRNRLRDLDKEFSLQLLSLLEKNFS